MIRSHVFRSAGEAYDASQVCDVVRDGDVLLIPSEGRAAVLVDAWPVLVGAGDPEPFHALSDGRTWQTFRNGDYYNAAVVAIALVTADGMKAAGLGINKPILDIARSYGWAGEIPEQERFIHD